MFEVPNARKLATAVLAADLDPGQEAIDEPTVRTRGCAATRLVTINLQHNQHVILMTGCNQWVAGLDVVVEGDAVRVTDEPTLLGPAAAWATKWDGRWHF